MNEWKVANFEITFAVNGGSSEQRIEVKVWLMFTNIDETLGSLFSQLPMPSLRHRRSCYLKHARLSNCAES
jgi:hypothetical protein